MDFLSLLGLGSGDVSEPSPDDDNIETLFIRLTAIRLRPRSDAIPFCEKFIQLVNETIASQSLEAESLDPSSVVPAILRRRAELADLYSKLAVGYFTRGRCELVGVRAVPPLSFRSCSRALEYSAKSLQICPKKAQIEFRAEIFRDRSVVRGHLGIPNFDEILSDMNQACALAPKDHTMFVSRAELFKSQQIHVEALRDYDTALRLVERNSVDNGGDFDPSEIEMKKADVLMRLGRLESIELIDRCLAREAQGHINTRGTKDRGEMQELRGMACLAFERFTEAISALTEAIDFATRAADGRPLADSYGSRAIAHFRTGNQFQAFQDFEKAVKEDESWRIRRANVFTSVPEFAKTIALRDYRYLFAHQHPLLTADSYCEAAMCIVEYHLEEATMTEVDEALGYLDESEKRRTSSSHPHLQETNQRLRKKLEEKKAAPPERVCRFCQRISCDGALRKCSVCKKVRYCSRLCQKKDWSRHKQECSRHQ